MRKSSCTDCQLMRKLDFQLMGKLDLQLMKKTNFNPTIIIFSVSHRINSTFIANLNGIYFAKTLPDHPPPALVIHQQKAKLM